VDTHVISNYTSCGGIGWGGSGSGFCGPFAGGVLIGKSGVGMCGGRPGLGGFRGGSGVVFISIERRAMESGPVVTADDGSADWKSTEVSRNDRRSRAEES
jgi:hypothetical protein